MTAIAWAIWCAAVVGADAGFTLRFGFGHPGSIAMAIAMAFGTGMLIWKTVSP